MFSYNHLSFTTIFLFIILSFHVNRSISSSISLPGCPDKCGNISIPYPFGLTPACSRELYGLICNETYNPPKLFINGSSMTVGGGRIEITSISLQAGQASILIGALRQCYDSTGLVNSTSSYMAFGPFPFRASTQNRFFAFGCNTFAYFVDGPGYYVSGCVSLCRKESNITDGSCSGVGCCQSTITPGIYYYEPYIEDKFNKNTVADFSPCSYAFLADQHKFSFRASDMLRTDDFKVPVLLDWAIRPESCNQAKSNASTFACRSANSFCFGSSNDAGYLCNCSKGYQGNPYIEDGCQDIDECSLPKEYPCYGRCINTVGGYNCTCPRGQNGNASIQDGCRSKDTFTPALKGVTAASISIFLIALVCFWGYIGYQKRKFIRTKQKFFEQNGGLLIQQQVRSHGDATFRIFTKEELEKATNNFDSNRILGRGGHGTVYKGTLEDKRIVAIKKAKILDENQIKEFAKEMLILSLINHKNVVKLLGCCLEVEVPMLVYEYVPNGTVFYYLHGRNNKSTISVDIRLKIAIETAEALSYLHSYALPPILHGDVKSANILLDENFTAKVADFGASKLAPNDEAQLATLVQGTCGYLDPEYMMTCQLTYKSDVYSFGVVLLELLTGRKALHFEGPEEERCLASTFTSAMKENRLVDIFDVEVMNEGGEFVEEIAELAGQCLKITGEERPSMKEVTESLERLRRFRKHPWHINSDETESLLSTRTETTIDEATSNYTF